MDGLKPVDLILRRMEAEECDPLELRADLMLGVAGLMRATRAGNVIVANALGSGLAETKAMLPFLQHLCRQLFCEDLRLPNASTWWCGDEQVRDYVLDNLDRLSIDSAFKRRSLLSRTTSAVPRSRRANASPSSTRLPRGATSTSARSWCRCRRRRRGPETACSRGR